MSLVKLKGGKLGMYREYHVLSLAAAALLPCALFLSPAASPSDGFDFRRRRLWSARRFLQLFFASSNSSSRWNLNEKFGW